MVFIISVLLKQKVYLKHLFIILLIIFGYL